ncbi:hypothetical protein ACEPAH_7701 [Sanghuangporus vaninii]
MTRSQNHSTLIEAHTAFTSLLQHALTIKLTLSEQHKFLRNHSRYQSLALEVVSQAIDKGQSTQAIEFLEQGRALLWSQMRGFRTPFGHLSEVHGTLAETFEGCNRRLEALVTLSESRTSGSSSNTIGIRGHGPFHEQRSIDEMSEQVRRLSEEQEVLINDIRRISGFGNFLKTKRFNALQQAASKGPVIVVNHSKCRCDALIVLSRENDPVVSKVVRKLVGLGIQEGSRIWWCPSSVLSAFPFHAAGSYLAWDGDMKDPLDD